MKTIPIFFLLISVAWGDTPAPGTVKAKTYTGDGLTAITSTGAAGALDVNVTNSGGLSTVNQGTAGTDPWFVSVRNNAPLPVNACQETGGNLATIASELGAPLAVTGTFWQSVQPVSVASPLPAGTNTIGKVDINGTIPISGSLTANQGTPGPTASPWPVILESGSTTSATQSGSWTVTSNAGTGTFVVDGSGHTQPVSGTFWQATQPVSGTVTANIGTSGSLALDATVSGLQVAQGSTTSGQNGELLQGAVTTGAPTYVTGKTDPLSLTTAGALRIDGSATTQPVSGTFWQSTQPVSLSTLPALTAGSAIIGKVGIDQTIPGTTNGVQVNAALPAGTNVIGKVSIDQTTPGTTNLVALAANQSVNLAQINGVTTLVGNGTAGTGAQRVTIASDNTAFTVNAAPKTPAALTVKQAAITVGTSAVRLTNDGNAPPSTRALLVAQLITGSTANCYFGSSGVTSTSTTRGVQMFAGQTFSFSNDAGDYFAICDTASQTFYITEQE